MKALNNNYKVLLCIILGIAFNVWAYERPLIEAIFALAYLMLFYLYYLQHAISCCGVRLGK